MDLNDIISALIVGALVLLSFLKLSNVTRVNRRANIFFGIFTLLWASFWLDEMIIPAALAPGSLAYTVLHVVQFLVPIMFYISVKIYASPGFQFKRISLFYFLAPLVFTTLLLNEDKLDPKYFNIVYLVLFLGHSIYYTISAYFRIVRHQRDIEQFHSSTEDIDLRWIKYIIYAFISSSLLITVYNILTTSQALNIYINLFFLSVAYFVSFYSLRQKEIYPKEAIIAEQNQDVADGPLNQQADAQKAEKPKLLTEQELSRFKEQLIVLMDQQKPYLDSELNLIKLAELMNLSTHQLSFLINTGMGSNFFNFINSYRVNKAKELLVCPEHAHLNMLVIGFQSGFNSKTSFNTTFKKFTGLTPTDYRNKKSRN